jgi:hypothetical protein
MGRLKELTGGYNTGLLVLAGIVLVQAAIVLSLRLTPKVAPA